MKLGGGLTVAVESRTDLRAHVCQEKSIIHGFLAELCVCGGDLYCKY